MGRRELLAIVASNSDLFIRTVCLLAMFNVTARISASFGTTILAANSVLLQVTFLCSYLFDGLTNASSVFSGRSVGARDLNLLRETWMRTNQWTVFFMVVMVLALDIFAGATARLFTDLPEVLASYADIHLWGAFPWQPVSVSPTMAYSPGVTRPAPSGIPLSWALATFLLALPLCLRFLGNHGLWLAVLCFYAGRSLYLLPFSAQVRAKVQAPAPAARHAEV